MMNEKWNPNQEQENKNERNSKSKVKMGKNEEETVRSEKVRYKNADEVYEYND